MGRPTVLLTLAAAVLLAACGRGAPTSSMSDRPATSDVRFVLAMLGYHQQAIEMAVLVDGRSRRQQLIKFAATIVMTRQAEISTMQGLSTRWNQPPPPATTVEDAGSLLPGMQGRGQLDWLKLRKGPRFDLSFLTMMDTHHGGVVEVATTELQAGASAEVKALAKRIVKMHKAELRQLHKWKDAWSSEAGQPSGG
jgi:uncharacterized protein (DUF305 family)